MSLHAVQYTYTDDAAGRAEHRAAHREFLRGLADEGVLLLCGPYTDQDWPGALLVFTGLGPDDITARLADDPFQQRGLVGRTQIRGWDVIIGAKQQELTEA